MLEKIKMQMKIDDEAKNALAKKYGIKFLPYPLINKYLYVECDNNNGLLNAETKDLLDFIKQEQKDLSDNTYVYYFVNDNKLLCISKTSIIYINSFSQIYVLNNDGSLNYYIDYDYYSHHDKFKFSITNKNSYCEYSELNNSKNEKKLFNYFYREEKYKHLFRFLVSDNTLYVNSDSILITVNNKNNEINFCLNTLINKTLRNIIFHTNNTITFITNLPELKSATFKVSDFYEFEKAFIKLENLNINCIETERLISDKDISFLSYYRKYKEEFSIAYTLAKNYTKISSILENYQDFDALKSLLKLVFDHHNEKNSFIINSLKLEKLFEERDDLYRIISFIEINNALNIVNNKNLLLSDTLEKNIDPIFSF